MTGKFDTKVQELKYAVLVEIIRRAYEGGMEDVYTEVPKQIIKGPKAELRCCIYKERAILQERIKLGLGGNKNNPNVVEVIDIACDECPIGGIFVTPACRGCIVHRCKEVCPKEAITIIDKKAVVDKSKCIECGRCTKACPYGAIIEQHRPCIVSCKPGAISMDENKKAHIDDKKCVACGACVYQCPFGAIQDKSLVTEVIDLLKGSNEGKNYKTYAVIAPSIVSQFGYAKIEQVVTGIKKLGFFDVVEAALGADVCLDREAKEWQEKGVMTTSCCPAFVNYVEKNFPDLVQYVSHTPSPMVQTALFIKSTDPTAKVVFIGPCTAKKLEYKLPRAKGAVDSVLSFEELQAFLDARRIDVSSLEETFLDNASFYGRIFAKAGGITEGVAAVAKRLGVEGIKPVSMNGIPECKLQLLKLRAGRSEFNFFEGMACEGGCINGALCLHHGPKNALDVDKYGKAAKEKDVTNSVALFDMHVKSDV